MFMSAEILASLLSAGGITIGVCGCKKLNEVYKKFSPDPSAILSNIKSEFDVVKVLRILNDDLSLHAVLVSQEPTCEKFMKFMMRSVIMNDSYNQMWSKEGNLVNEHVRIFYDNQALYELIEKELKCIVDGDLVIGKLSDPIVNRLYGYLDREQWQKVYKTLVKHKLINRMVF